MGAGLAGFGAGQAVRDGSCRAAHAHVWSFRPRAGTLCSGAEYNEFKRVMGKRLVDGVIKFFPQLEDR